ncbi:MAG TPA: M28 family metallopeptidase [Sphingomicrobium sp.]|nr:M28 family metallopeptidase [Sphingomicrobium sp.]
MKIVHLFAATAIALVAGPVAAADTGSFSPQLLSQHVKTLGSDAYEGRGVNTRAETKTVDYIIGQFQGTGLQPGGDLVNGQRKWTQDVPLLQSDWAAAPQASISLNGQQVPLTQGEEITMRAPTNGQTAVNLSNTPLVFVGYGVKAPERSWDDFKGEDLHGKIMVVLVNDPDFEGGEGDFGGKAMTYYGRWTYKYEEGARQGATGVLVIHESAPASYGWNTVKNSNTNTMFDIVRKDPTADHPLLEGWIQRDLAQKIFAASGLDIEAMKAAAKRKDFRPVALKATLNATGTARTEVITSHNVVGLLPGKTHPDETVIYSAHWDHLGIGKPDSNGDKIYNGALDNASGISHLIEQARAFAKGPRPDRSVVFLAVTAEEKGLLGSEYYAANPLYPLSKTVGVLNTDSMGLWGPAKNFSISGTAKLGLLDDLIAEGKKEGRYFTADPHPESGGFYRSDHFSFAKVGVPAISFKSGNDLVNGGTERGEAITSDYTAKRYHQPDDEFQPDWDFSGQAQDAQLLHELGERLANSREWPNWSADSEFRATRDQSAGERPGAGGERG